MSAALICLAVHNGARWLPEQIESIRRQTDSDWLLWASDDGSGDGSLEILLGFAAKDARIRLLPDRRERGDAMAGLGAAANFEYLLTAALASQREVGWQFLALCDQDDIWVGDKLCRQRATLAEHAACCSDLLLVNAAGEAAGGTMLKQLRAPPQPRLASLLAQNSVVGCTLALRQEVLELALPFPEGLVNHDWWLALCAVALGTLYCDPAALVHYRQHEANVVGAFRPGRQLVRLGSLLRRQGQVLESQQRAAAELAQRLSQRGEEPPPLLQGYLKSFAGTRPLRRAGEQLTGEFAARSLSLRVLRSLAELGLFNAAGKRR